MNTRALLGVSAALALAVACPAYGAVQVSQSGWQWGNPTPQGNTIRAMDFDQGRGYAIGDDGTALRTDDGGATWAGLPTGTSLDLARLQVVTPDTVIVLGGNGCVVRRSDDGGKTFTKMYVLTEIGLPGAGRRVLLHRPEHGLPVPAQRQRPAHHRQGPDLRRVTAIPTTPESGGRRHAASRATRSSPRPTPASSSSPAPTAPTARPTQAGRGRRSRDVPAGRRAADEGGTLRVRPEHAAAQHRHRLAVRSPWAASRSPASAAPRRRCAC